MLSEACHGGPRRYGPVSPTGHHQLGARAGLDRHRRPARVPQLLAAAGRTLRAGCHVMLGDGRARQVEADDVIAQLRAKTGGDCFGDFEGGKLDAALPDCMAGERRNGDGARRSAVKKPLDLPVPYHAIEKTGPTGAFARDEHGSHQGKGAGGLHQQPRRFVRYTLPVQLRQLPFEIVVHERDGQVGRTLDDANAKFAQRRIEFGGTLHIDRLNAHATIPEICVGHPGRQTETGPVAGDAACGRVRYRHDIAALEQPLERLVDLVGWKILLQPANQLAQASAVFSDRGGEGTIKLAVKEEFAVLGIEAHDIGGQHIGGEIRRELQNLFAGGPLGRALGMARHEVITRMLLATPDRSFKAHSPGTGAPWSSARWPFSLGRRSAWPSCARLATHTFGGPPGTHELAGSTSSNPAMTPCVCQYMRNAA